jgi:nitroreductase
MEHLLQKAARRKVAEVVDMSTLLPISGATAVADTEPGPPEEVTDVVVGAAVWAPSVHNTQPWWFSHDSGQISLHADVERRLAVADPNGREMMISCGAALFTVRMALRSLGYVPEARVLPDPDLPTLIARVSWHERVPATDYEKDLFDQVTRRHTHRGGFDQVPLPPDLISALRQSVSRHGVMLLIMADDDRRTALAAAVETAEHAVRIDGARSRELTRWAPAPGSKRRDGVRPDAYPAREERTDPSFPGRDFAHGRGWGYQQEAQALGLRSAGVVGVLCTARDAAADWVNTGQALQRLLLSASLSGAATALHSQPLEFPQLREFVRTQLCDAAFPQLVLRLGTTSQRAVSVRRPVGDVLL